MAGNISLLSRPPRLTKSPAGNDVSEQAGATDASTLQHHLVVGVAPLLALQKVYLAKVIPSLSAFPVAGDKYSVSTVAEDLTGAVVPEEEVKTNVGGAPTTLVGYNIPAAAVADTTSGSSNEAPTTYALVSPADNATTSEAAEKATLPFGATRSSSEEISATTCPSVSRNSYSNFSTSKCAEAEDPMSNNKGGSTTATHLPVSNSNGAITSITGRSGPHSLNATQTQLMSTTTPPAAEATDDVDGELTTKEKDADEEKEEEEAFGIEQYIADRDTDKDAAEVADADEDAVAEDAFIQSGSSDAQRKAYYADADYDAGSANAGGGAFADDTDGEAHLHLRLRAGQRIGGGRYKVIKRLGEGQSSRVWLAEIVEGSPVGDVGDRVAVKVCKRGGLYADAVAYERQTIEYLSQGGESAPFGGGGGGTIAALLDEFEERSHNPTLGDDEDEDEFMNNPSATIHPCLVFKPLGAPLDQIMSITNYNGINPRAVRQLTRNILRIAIRLAEKHIIHTDLKPENLLLASPTTLKDEAVASALQPTVKFLVTPSPSRCPSIANGAGTPRSRAGIAGDSSPAASPSPRSGTPRAGGAVTITQSMASATSTTATNRRVSMAGGGDGPLIPALAAGGANPLDIVLIDFGLSYFEPHDRRPPKAPRRATSSRTVSAGPSPVATSLSAPPLHPSTHVHHNDSSASAAYTSEQLALAEACNYQLGVEIQTREYRAPEIILGRPFNTRTDLWSVACIAYELVTGRYLFDPKLPYKFEEGAYDEETGDPIEEDEVAHKRREDAEHLKLITYTIGAINNAAQSSPSGSLSATLSGGTATNPHRRATVLERGVHEDTFYYDGEDGIPRLYDLAITSLPENSLMSLPSTPVNGDDNHDCPTHFPTLRDIDAEVRPFLGPMESPLFVSFLMKCLKWSPNDRPAPEELLSHPWLALRPEETDE